MKTRQGVCNHHRHKRLHLLQNCNLSAGHIREAAQHQEARWNPLALFTHRYWFDLRPLCMCTCMSSLILVNILYVDMLLFAMRPLSPLPKCEVSSAVLSYVSLPGDFDWVII